jgi:hypothetical protein
LGECGEDFEITASVMHFLKYHMHKLFERRAFFQFKSWCVHSHTFVWDLTPYFSTERAYSHLLHLSRL